MKSKRKSFQQGQNTFQQSVVEAKVQFIKHNNINLLDLNQYSESNLKAVLQVGPVGVHSSFNNYNCLGTTSRFTPQGHLQGTTSMQTHSAVTVRVGFKLATNCIQFYVFPLACRLRHPSILQCLILSIVLGWAQLLSHLAHSCGIGWVWHSASVQRLSLLSSSGRVGGCTVTGSLEDKCSVPACCGALQQGKD